MVYEMIFHTSFVGGGGIAFVHHITQHELCGGASPSFNARMSKLEFYFFATLRLEMHYNFCERGFSLETLVSSSP